MGARASGAPPTHPDSSTRSLRSLAQNDKRDGRGGLAQNDSGGGALLSLARDDSGKGSLWSRRLACIFQLCSAAVSAAILASIDRVIAGPVVTGRSFAQGEGSSWMFSHWISGSRRFLISSRSRGGPDRPPPPMPPMPPRPPPPIPPASPEGGPPPRPRES